jgi:hypothetical protein
VYISVETGRIECARGPVNRRWNVERRDRMNGDVPENDTATHGALFVLATGEE